MADHDKNRVGYKFPVADSRNMRQLSGYTVCLEQKRNDRVTELF